MTSDILQQQNEPPNSFQDWNKLPPNERLKKINKSRNYLRYKLIKGLRIESHHPLLTPEERLFVKLMNDNLDAIQNAKFGLLRTFYENCPKVGSTLVKKEKSEKNVTILTNETIDGQTEIGFE